MATINFGNRRFDARPDRIDFRDLQYRPALVSLKPEYPSQHVIEKYLPEYEQAGLILDQGSEGACTGFGLAAVVNYLFWKRWRVVAGDRAGDPAYLAQTPAPTGVSQRMLYHLARIYDEWEGEDYEGSSCRGAMKGWDRHGVCSEAHWPYRDKRKNIRFLPPKIGWEQDAARRPLGAYYRIDKDSIVHLQAAIQEVGAIYASATVHEGWFLPTQSEPTLIEFKGKAATGGHAFALVGYTVDGFIVQNSWGPQWGFHGFAIIDYADWIAHGQDAWATVLGAPVRVNIPQSRSGVSLQRLAASQSEPDNIPVGKGQHFRYSNRDAVAWDEANAYRHTLLLGNDGRPINRLLSARDAAAAVDAVTIEQPRAWLKQLAGKKKLALYAHGGLNSEEDSLKRIRLMAPYFEANGIYPLFVTWRTGFLESIHGLLGDAISKSLQLDADQRAAGWLSDLTEAVGEAKDRAIEAAAERILAKAVWSQIKQNADAAAARGAGLWQLAQNLKSLRAEMPDLELHLIGHSAGAILFGHLIDRLVSRKVKVASLHLYAPACTVAFANRHYGKALDEGVLPGGACYLDNMDNERELADSVGPYGKSLLYLVSRALESVHKTPLLGLAAAWDPSSHSEDLFNGSKLKNAKKWNKRWAKKMHLRLHTKQQQNVWDGQGYIPLAHGSFDNDVEVVTRTLELIRGGPLDCPVENLRGF